MHDRTESHLGARAQSPAQKQINEIMDRVYDQMDEKTSLINYRA